MSNKEPSKLPDTIGINDNSSKAKLKVPTEIDNNNKAAIKKLSVGITKENLKEPIKHMFTHPDTGKPLLYSEMRWIYG